MDVTWTDEDGRDHAIAAGHVLVNAAPRVLDELLGHEPIEGGPEGSQLKINMRLRRLPRLRDPAVDPSAAFAGTFHINESYQQLATAYAQAAAGNIPTCRQPRSTATPSATRRSSAPNCAPAVITPSRSSDCTCRRASSVPTPRAPGRQHSRPTLRSLNSVLAEPIEDCLALDADGRPCIEVRTPLDLERDIALPGGHIFHRDLQWPWLEGDHPRTPAERWGVATDHDRVLLCGAGARRGGGVSGIPGRSAAMAVFESAL